VPRHGIGQQVQRSSAGSTPHDRITILQICSSHPLPLHRPRQSALGYPAFAAKWSPTHSFQRHPPLIHGLLPLRPTRWDGPTPITHLIRGIQIPIVNAAPPTSPSRGFLVWGFFCQGVRRAANLLHFVSFFVRSQSPFLRPDPRLADVVARRSCQGWPSRQPCGMLRACQAIP
jgi:hypothetical protein